MKQRQGTLEIHRHGYIGERQREEIEHAHEGGDRPHRHQHCGPAHYTIDKDEWLRATGLVGGGRKEYAAQPTGPQFPIVPIEPEENTFRVIFVDEYTDGHASAGISPERFAAERATFVADMADGGVHGYVPARLHQTFGMIPIYELHGPASGETSGDADPSATA